MKDLQNIKSTLSSLEIAEMLETEHSKLIRKLEGGRDRKGYIQIMTEAQMGVSDFFIQDTHRDASGKN